MDQDNNPLFAFLFRNGPMLMTLSSLPQRCFVEVNERFLNTLGYQRDQVIGKTAEELALFVQPDIETQISADLRRNSMIRDFDLQLRASDGRLIEGLLSASLVVFDGQEYVLSMLADITKRKHWEDHLDASASLLDKLSRQVPGMIYQYQYFPDGRSCFPFASEAIHELLELSPAAVKSDGEVALRLIHPDDAVRVRQSIANSFVNLNLWTEDFRVNLPRKGVRWLRGTARVQSSRYAEDGSMLWYGHLSDITEHKNAEEALRSANRMLEKSTAYSNTLALRAEAANRAKTAFLANMSHEIRTPLNGVLGMLQLLETTTLDDEQRDYIATALESGNILLQLLSDVLDLSKIEAGDMVLVESEFSLHEFISTSTRVFYGQARKQGLHLNWHITPELPDLLCADVGRMRQIMLNLLSNAIKFTSSGRIEVSVTGKQQSATQWQICLCVSDTGIGIAAEQLEQIFAPFTQVDESTTRRFQGCGLGLTIVKRLLDLMGGSIEAESVVNEGSQMYIYLPVHSRESCNSTTQPSLVVSDQHDLLAPSWRILVAEDQPTNQVLIRRILIKLGHQVEVVSDGNKVLERLRKVPFDLILMDVEMPQLDGIEATRIIRANKTADLPAAIPIIALTAHAIRGDPERCIACGMNDYLAKPVSFDNLAERINRLMAESSRYCK